MSWFSKMFGGGKPEPEPVVHKGFRIIPAPETGQGGFRVGARIEFDADGETRTHLMIRADVCQSAEEAERVSVLQAKRLIDQLADGIFDGR